MNRLTRIRLANFLLFQVGWLACVLGAANGIPWLGAVFVTLAASLHLYWAHRPWREARLLAACALIGLFFDGLLLATGWVGFSNGWWLPGLAPYWMMFMWILFGTTLNLSLVWLQPRPALAAAFGAIGGPVAYYAGERLGGIQLANAVPALVALAIAWGLVTPILLRIAARLNGFERPKLAAYVHRDIVSDEVSHHV